MVIICFIIIGFSLIFLSFNRDDGYATHLYGAYQVLYGNYDDSEYSVSQKLIVSLILFLLNVLLLNLLISIMGDSYGKVQETRVLTDSLTRLEMIFQIIAYKRLFRREGDSQKGHLIYCLKAEAEEEEEAQGSEGEGKSSLRNELIKEKVINTESEVLNMKIKVLDIESKMANMDDKMDKIMKLLESSQKDNQK